MPIWNGKREGNAHKHFLHILGMTLCTGFEMRGEIKHLYTMMSCVYGTLLLTVNTYMLPPGLAPIDRWFILSVFNSSSPLH